MKKYFLLFIITVFTASLFAAEPELSGVLDSTVNYTAGGRDASSHYWGIEEYANLRMRIRTREKATVFAAFNLIAISGNYLDAAALMEITNPNQYFAATPYVYGGNFAAAMELERLYFRINGDNIDTEAGLLRMNFGYGQVWGSSDFLNPRNPLFPNARPRGLLGMNASFYPADSLKLMGFAAAPKNPMGKDGGGFIPGLCMDQHWDRASLQVLYAYETPINPGENLISEEPGVLDMPPPTASPNGIHRFGLSLKADLKLGFVVDALYMLNPDKPEGIDGLSAGAGFDYNFFDGDLYILFEYLYNGLSSVSAARYGGDWSNNHYLYGTALYSFNDYSSLSFSTVFCFDDLSFSPFATLNYELFQGFSFNLTARFCFDQKDFGGNKAGELGPAPPLLEILNDTPFESQRGARVIVNAGVRLRF